jgi:carbon-monoxide dehydrogenase medium subunit
MRPFPFAYHRPTNLPDALTLMGRWGEAAAFYAGGTELLLALKARVLRYDHLIDLKRIPELRGIRRIGDAIEIGGLSTHHEIARDPLVCETLPAYAALSGAVANIRVRVAGTIAGNLCFAEPHADPPALLCAYDASVRLQGPEGARDIPMTDFIRSEFQTERRGDEVLTALIVPTRQPGARFVFKSFKPHHRPVVTLAAGAIPAGSGRDNWRIWIGALGERPQHCADIETALSALPPGKVADALPELADRLSKTVEAADDLYGSADYKRHLAGVLLRRAVTQVIAETSEGRP